MLILECIFPDFTDEAVFTMTSRGRFKLVHNGYEYTERTGARYAKRQEETKSWRCIRNRRYYCKGKAITRQIGSKQMIHVYGEHDHPPETSENNQFKSN